MWVVLDAEPGAGIIYGLKEKIDRKTFRDAVDIGSLDKYLYQIPIKMGDYICVPSRTVHAILEGVLIAEIQQNSNTTYRLFDWNRLGDDGIPRELHVEKALDVINFDQVGSKLPRPQPLKGGKGLTAERLCENQYFSTERITMEKEAIYSGLCDGSTLEIWGVLKGCVKVEDININQVNFVLLPAALGPYTIVANDDATLLRTFVR